MSRYISEDELSGIVQCLDSVAVNIIQVLKKYAKDNNGRPFRSVKPNEKNKDRITSLFSLYESGSHELYYGKAFEEVTIINHISNLTIESLLELLVVIAQEEPWANK